MWCWIESNAHDVFLHVASRREDRLPGCIMQSLRSHTYTNVYIHICLQVNSYLQVFNVTYAHIMSDTTISELFTRTCTVSVSDSVRPTLH